MTARNPVADPRPVSDVSSAVGFVGVGGLCAWILFCHFYPDIAPLVGLSAERGRLTGPMAALFGLVAAALPMVLWSVLVDKVHRRPSTGIDWDHPRPVADIIDISITKLAGLWATWALIAGLQGAGFQLGLYGLICVAVAGLYGAATVSRRILVVQTVPAAAAIPQAPRRTPPRTRSPRASAH